MLDLPYTPTPIPTPAPFPKPEETACKESSTFDEATVKSIVVAEPKLEPKAKDVHILHGWNMSLITMGKLHKEVLDCLVPSPQGFMHGYTTDMKQILLDLLVSEEQALLLTDCHEELMAHATEEKAKAKAVKGACKKAPVCNNKGEEEQEEEDTDVGSDILDEADGTIYVKLPKEAPHKGKGKGKVQAKHPDMGEPKYGNHIPCTTVTTLPVGTRTLSANSAPPAPTAPCKALCKIKEDYPPVGHTTTDNAGESELNITNALPPPQKKKEEKWVTLSLPGHTRIPSKPEEATCPIAGPLHKRAKDGEMVRLCTENACLQKENVALHELHVCQYTFLFETHHHMHTSLNPSYL
ncbi:hypothetical protein EDD22DRAFT_955801 [Suillus occidentalis]|nr:hypothetical protein EDD22DRAFT_955801 [Suillus occidentalis]